MISMMKVPTILPRAEIN